MDKIIIFRHGEHNHDVLNNEGKAQVKSLAEKLKTCIEKNKIVKIFSSNSTRAIMSAEIIKQFYRLDEITKIDIMGEHDYDVEKIYNFIKKEVTGVDIIILATHAQHVRLLPEYFSLEEWRKYQQINKVKPGEAILIDCLDKKIIELRQS